MIKTVFKILSIAIVSVIVLIALLFIMIRTGALNGFILNSAEKIAGKNLNGKLEIAELRGNIFSAFSLHGISLTLDEDTILNCERIEISYSPVSLLRKQVEIRKIFIDSLSLNADQYSDSSWNFMQLLKKPDTEDTSSGEFDWTVNVTDLRITDLTASISKATENRYIPEYLSSDISLAAFISGDTMKVRLDDFNLTMNEPDFKITKLSGIFSRTGELMAWEDVRLQLTRTMAGTSGSYTADENGMADISFQFTPLSKSSIRKLKSPLS